MSDSISKNFLYKSALEKLRAAYGSEADELWHLASDLLDRLTKEHPEISGSRRMMVLPAVALYQVIEERHPSEAAAILKAQGSEQGEKFKQIVEAYANRSNLKSQAILHHLGLNVTETSRSGQSCHYVGDCQKMLEKYRTGTD